MQRKQPNFNFMRLSRPFMILSAVLVVISIALLALRGIPLGLDFSGGVIVELQFQSSPDLGEIRSLLNQAGLLNPVVQHYGTDTDILIRLAADEGTSDIAQIAYNAVAATHPDVVLQRSEFIGAQIGDELLEQGGLGVLVALLAMLAYVAIRFQFKFAIGAVLALAHDVLFVLLILSILQVDFDLSVLAAVMTVVGYSLNDSLVIADHVREQVREQHKDDLKVAINQSLNRVFWRTINTSATTLLVTVTLMLFGGESIFPFAMSLSVGIIVGTYSSIYILCSVLCVMKLQRKDLVVIDPDNQNKTIV